MNIPPGTEPGSSTPPIRVLVVDDSFFMRTVLAKLLRQAGGLDVVGTAKNGREGVEKNLELLPDVVTLDVEMPEMDGLEALSRIMQTRPVPVVMLSAHTESGTETAIRALEKGAVECLAKPSGSVSIDIHKILGELTEKIRLAAKSRPQRSPGEGRSLASRSGTPAPTRTARRLVAVASSTGGPRALHEFVSLLPEDLPAAVVIVQHMSQGFTRALAKRLGEAGALPVTEALEGETLLDGRVYVAPTGRHLLVEGIPGSYHFTFSDAPPRNGVRPAADLLMSSVAGCAKKSAVGMVLTGMGKDGARGLLEMRNAGARTFAQEPGSCVVYGMPKAAVECGAVEDQATVAALTGSVIRHLTGGAG